MSKLGTLLKYFQATKKVNNTTTTYWSPGGADAHVYIDGEEQRTCTGITYSIANKAGQLAAKGSLLYSHPDSPGTSRMKGMHNIRLQLNNECGDAALVIDFNKVSFTLIDSGIAIDDIAMEELHFFEAKGVVYTKSVTYKYLD